MTMTDNCKTCRAALPDLLLDHAYTAAHPEAAERAAAHMKACAECRAEWEDLRSTFALLDSWEAPEPSPYFDARLHVRLREAASAAPEPMWERVRSFFLFSTTLQMRPALAAAMGLAILLGGGTAAEIYQHQTTMVSQTTSPAVNDLKIMDNNAQALQQMDLLLDDSGSKPDGNSSALPTT
jgi:predicted anti-sigma-YlaC factor YlaD